MRIISILSFIWIIAFSSYMEIKFFTKIGTVLPDFTLVYASAFEKMLMICVSSIWFYLVSIAGFFIICFVFSQESGWQNLATKYANNFDKKINRQFSQSLASIGGLRYSGTLKIFANSQGIYLKTLFFFRLGHQDLFIPWSAIKSIHHQDTLLLNGAPKLLKNVKKIIQNNHYRKIELKEFSEQVLIVQWPVNFDDLIPSSVPHDALS